jgi:hypothetical protein
VSSSNQPSKRPNRVKARSAQRPNVTAKRPRLLSQVELDEDEVLIDDFDATLKGVMVRITAVLERTCVYVDKNGDRRLARKNELWVEADKLPVRRRGVG